AASSADDGSQAASPSAHATTLPVAPVAPPDPLRRWIIARLLVRRAAAPRSPRPAPVLAHPQAHPRAAPGPARPRSAGPPGPRPRAAVPRRGGAPGPRPPPGPGWPALRASRTRRRWPRARGGRPPARPRAPPPAATPDAAPGHPAARPTPASATAPRAWPRCRRRRPRRPRTRAPRRPRAPRPARPARPRPARPRPAHERDRAAAPRSQPRARGGRHRCVASWESELALRAFAVAQNVDLAECLASAEQEHVEGADRHRHRLGRAVA